MGSDKAEGGGETGFLRSLKLRPYLRRQKIERHSKFSMLSHMTSKLPSFED